MTSDNKLWEGHRMILPEMREKTIYTCRDCRFLVEIEGREEIRWGCVVGIPRYGRLERRVPRRLSAMEVLYMVGKEGLQQILAAGRPEGQACGSWRRR